MLDGNPELEGMALIEGFPGAGLVGPMAVSYIIDKLAMEPIGHIESPDFPPLIAVHGDKPMYPVRIYFSKKAGIIALFAEFAIPIESTYDISNALYDFAKQHKITEIVSIGGIPFKPEQIPTDQVFFIASNEDMRAKATKAGLKAVGEGVATGVSALIMIRSVSEGMPDLSILVPIDPNILDPKYAEIAIKGLNKVMGLNIDTTELDKEAKDVEAKVRELMKKNKERLDVHRQIVGGEGPSMYG